MTRTAIHRPTARLLIEKIQRLSSVRFPGPVRDWRFERTPGEYRDDGFRWRLVRESEPFGGLVIGSRDKVDAVLSANRIVVIPEGDVITVKVEF